jgi:hypothetical protein
MKTVSMLKFPTINPEFGHVTMFITLIHHILFRLRQ